MPIDRNVMTDYLWLLPASVDMAKLTDPGDNPSAIVSKLIEHKATFPAFPALGTRVYNGKAILYLRMSKRFSVATQQTFFDNHGLNWVAIGIRESYLFRVKTGVDGNGGDVFERKHRDFQAISKAQIANFLIDVAVYDPQTEITTYRRPINGDVISLPVYAGSTPIVIS